MKNLNPLGQQTHYIDHYTPDLLFSIPRSESRNQLFFQSQVDFFGEDAWTCYELSWLNPNGKPQIAIAEIRIPCDSPNLVESKSLKLYLNSLNQTQFASTEALIQTLTTDISDCVGTPVTTQLHAASQSLSFNACDAVCIDEIDVSPKHYQPDATILRCNQSDEISEHLVSHVFKSNCPVTGQPDWASVFIKYQGKAVSHEHLLEYLISYRHHAGFHEACVEQIFYDISTQCEPKSLCIAARFLRRGGIDINPIRSSSKQWLETGRTARQ